MTFDTQKGDSAKGGTVTFLCTCLNFKPETDEVWQDLAQTYTDQTGVDVRVVTAADGQYDTTLQSVSKSILILAKGTSNMLFSNIIEAVQVILEKSNYTLRVNYLDEEANEVSEAIRVCREHKPMGILFLGSNAAAAFQKASDYSSICNE